MLDKAQSLEAVVAAFSPANLESECDVQVEDEVWTKGWWQLLIPATRAEEAHARCPAPCIHIQETQADSVDRSNGQAVESGHEDVDDPEGAEREIMAELEAHNLELERRAAAEEYEEMQQHQTKRTPMRHIGRRGSLRR